MALSKLCASWVITQTLPDIHLKSNDWWSFSCRMKMKCVTIQNCPLWIIFSWKCTSWLFFPIHYLQPLLFSSKDWYLNSKIGLFSNWLVLGWYICIGSFHIHISNGSTIFATLLDQKVLIRFPKMCCDADSLNHEYSSGSVIFNSN